jgi:hypothetical protein
MITYNLSSDDRSLIDLALSVIAQTYDQYSLNSPDPVFRLREKIRKSSTVQLITDAKKRTFADEA